MDDRFDARYPSSLDVLLINLTDQSRICRGRMSDVSQSGLSVILPIAFAAGTEVKLDFADSSLFGRVVHSQEQDGAFRTGIEVEQVHLGGTDLSRLLQGILQHEMPEVPGVTEPVAVRNLLAADR